MKPKSDGATKRQSDEGSTHSPLRRSVAPSLRRSSFNLATLRPALKPFRLHWFPRLRSTSDHAAVLRKRGDLFAPAVVLTGHQSAGRGRGANTWWSQPGVLTVTFVFPVDDHVAPHQLPLLAGLAVRDAAASLVPAADVQLKWPNDLLVNGRKLAGLLCERVHKADLVGLGLNVNVDPAAAPPTLRDRLTSLQCLAAGPQDRSPPPLDMTHVLTTIAHRLHGMLSHQNDRTFAQLLRQYDEHHFLLGRRVTVSTSPAELPISGRCEGLDPMGRLLLRQGRTLHHVIAGQVQLA